MSEDSHHCPESAPPRTRRRLSRRRVLVGLGGAVAAAGTVGYFAGGKDHYEEWAAKVGIAKDRFMDRIRADWEERNLSDSQQLAYEADYRTFLTGLKLRYVTAEEVIRPHRNVREGVANELPPRHMWPRLIPTLKIADEIRHRLGTPLDLINSAYRSPEYNLACSGAKHSYHMQNRALDLMFREGSKAASEVAMKLREENFFRGGIGVYPTFIHVDVRGFDATWGV
ncbi:MAG: D-Ala-D-Ala carboxypeptidase family metallohydrolase [Verrucomicrobiota bacterium]